MRIEGVTTPQGESAINANFQPHLSSPSEPKESMTESPFHVCIPLALVKHVGSL
jgi:hypothetical protein